MKEYKPLSEVRKKLRIKWYRCQIDKDVLRELTRKNDVKAWFQAGGHLALFVCTGITTYICFENNLWIAFSLALFAHGTVGSFFRGLATHELKHGTVFHSKILNKVFLYVFGLLSWHNFHEYAFSHTYHHLYTLHPDGDREVVLPKEPSLKWHYLLQLFTFNIFGGLESNGLIPIVKDTFLTALGKSNNEWIGAVYKNHDEERVDAIRLARMIIFFHFSIFILSIILEMWLLIILLTLFNFTGNGVRYFVGLPMHCGLRRNVPDFRKCVRTITLDPISEFLYWRMNWHLEHHMFAGVPCYNLKKLHQVISDDMPKPRTLYGAWKEMRDTWRKQQVEPGYEFETPVPVKQRKNPVYSEDPLSSSIGNLAPKSLA